MKEDTRSGSTHLVSINVLYKNNNLKNLRIDIENTCLVCLEKKSNDLAENTLDKSRLSNISSLYV